MKAEKRIQMGEKYWKNRYEAEKREQQKKAQVERVRNQMQSANGIVLFSLFHLHRLCYENLFRSNYTKIMYMIAEYCIWRKRREKAKKNQYQ